MYIVPRLFGIGCYAGVLFVISLLISRTNSIRKTKVLFLLYILSLSLMGYFYVYEQAADLSRHISTMNYVHGLSRNSLWNEIVRTGSPGFIIYLYIISVFQNDHFLPAVSAIICFSLLFSIAFTEAKRTKVSGALLWIPIFVLMSPGILMDSISGIRNMMSFCIIIWCVYRELVLGKTVLLHLPLYLIAASLHLVGFLLVIYRLLFLFLQRNKSFLKTIGTIIIGAAALFLILKFGGQYITKLVERGIEYRTSETEYTYFWNFFITILKIIVDFYLLYEYRILCKQKAGGSSTNNAYRSYVMFMIPIYVFSLIAPFIQYSFFTRTGMLLHLLGFPLCFFVLTEAKQSNRYQRIKNKLICFGLIILLFACARGDICSLKFFK